MWRWRSARVMGARVVAVLVAGGVAGGVAGARVATARCRVPGDDACAVAHHPVTDGAVVGVVVALVTAGALTGVLRLIYGYGVRRSDPRPVPRVLGLPLADAKAVLAEAGFEVSLRGRETPPNAPHGVVVTQRPRAGERLLPGSSVRVTTTPPA